MRIVYLSLYASLIPQGIDFLKVSFYAAKHTQRCRLCKVINAEPMHQAQVIMLRVKRLVVVFEDAPKVT